MNIISRPVAIVLTALPAEYKAVRAHLTALKEEIHPQGTVYERGIFSYEGQSWDIGIVEIGPGNAGAAMEAERAIQYFTPSVALFVGVAGGLKDVKLGDVVVGTKVYGYESGKAETRFWSRPDVGNSSYRMEQRARAEAKKLDWLKRIEHGISSPAPRVFVGPIAAGEKVVASTRSAVWKFIRSNYSDALAVEMEGRGFLEAAHANPQASALVIRGISDLIDQKSDADSVGFQEIAAMHASAFAFHVLANLRRVDDYSIYPMSSGDFTRCAGDTRKLREEVLVLRENLGLDSQAISDLRSISKRISELSDQIRQLLRDHPHHPLRIGIESCISGTIRSVNEAEDALKQAIADAVSNVSKRHTDNPTRLMSVLASSLEQLERFLGQSCD